MRRATPAVALLLAGAEAGVLKSRSGLLMNDSNNGVFPAFGAQDMGAVAITTGPISGADIGVKVTIAANGLTYSCVACIRDGGKWCSLEELAESAVAYKLYYTPESTVTSYKAVLTAVATGAAPANTIDKGTCCIAGAVMTKPINFWTTSTTNFNWAVDNAAETTVKQVIKWNKYQCPGGLSNNAATTMGTPLKATAGASTDKVTFDITAGHWCSDGPSGLTGGATANYVNDTTNKIDDPRTEVFLTMCRQRVDVCGGAALVAVASLGATATTQARAISDTKMTAQEKCTWFVKTKLGAPTFMASKNTGTIPAAANYMLHYAEYSALAAMAPEQQPAGKTNTTGLYKANFGWAKLKGRYYAMKADGTEGNYAGVQEMPNVFTVASTAAALSQWQKRWFPAIIGTQEVAAGLARNKAFTDLKTPYEAKVAEYNKQVAAQKKAGNPDFFKVLFGGVPKSTIPDKPRQPYSPGAYTGMSQVPFPGKTSYAPATAGAKSVATGALKKDKQFAVNGDHGGWGAFTMGILAPTDTMRHSFGMLGSTIVATGETASYVADKAAMCLAEATDTKGYCQVTAKFTTTNPSDQILVVSLWAYNGYATAGTNYAFWNTALAFKFKITFSVNAWARHDVEWTAPPTVGAATAADADPRAGAKMLAASTAAAAAVAAALY